MLRILLSVCVVLSACTSSVEPRPAERWSVDFPRTSQVMLLSWTTHDATVSGSGSLSALLVPGSTEPLVITGTRNADTLNLLLRRNGNPSLHFHGWYVGRGASITGILNGDEFDAVSVSFRKY